MIKTRKPTKVLAFVVSSLFVVIGVTLTPQIAFANTVNGTTEDETNPVIEETDSLIDIPFIEPTPQATHETTLEPIPVPPTDEVKIVPQEQQPQPFKVPAKETINPSAGVKVYTSPSLTNGTNTPTTPAPATNIAYTITPVIVSTSTKAEQWTEQEVKTYGQQAAGFWNTQLAGKLNITVAPVAHLKTPTAIETSSNAYSLVTQLTKEMGSTLESGRFNSYVFYIPVPSVNSSGKDVAAVSYNNNFPSVGLKATGGTVVMTKKVSSERQGYLLAHEIGHNFSIGHANHAECSDGTVDPMVNLKTKALDNTNCKINNYGDYLDIMSDLNGYGAVNSTTAYTRGITQSNEVLTVTPSATTQVFNLKPWGERKTNIMKAIRIPGVNGQGSYTVEVRLPVGLDAGQAINEKSGVRILKEDISNPGLSWLLTSPTGGGNAQTWNTGETFQSGDKRFSVKIGNITSTGASVEVKTITTNTPVPTYANNIKIDTPSFTGNYFEQEYPIKATFTDSKGNPVVGKKLQLWNGQTKFIERTTDSKGQASWALAKTLYANTYTYIVRTVDGSAKSAKYTVTVKPVNLPMSISEADKGVNIKLTKNTAPSAALKIYVDGTLHTTKPLADNFAYTIPRSIAKSGSVVKLEYPKDRGHNAYNLTYNVPIVKQTVSFSLNRTNNGYQMMKTDTTQTSTGTMKVYLDDKLYKTLPMIKNFNYTLPSTAYKNGTKIRWVYSGDSKWNSYTKTHEATRLALNLSLSKTASTEVSVKVDPKTVVTPVGTLKIYVADKIRTTANLRAGLTLKISGVKKGQVVKVVYTGNGNYNGFTKTFKQQ